MPGLLADANFEGQFLTLMQICASDAWRELWSDLGVEAYTFEQLGLKHHAPDAVVWRLCQARGIILLTGNRNEDGPDSLNAVIHAETTAETLPVFTISDTDRFSRDSIYAARVAVKLMEYLMDLDRYRGTGRLYLP
jgi:hypothetical protein